MLISALLTVEILILVSWSEKIDAYSIKGHYIEKSRRQNPYRTVIPIPPQLTSDRIIFPTGSLLDNRAIRPQRAVKSGSRQQNIVINFPSMIVFDEDNDEPLVPEPIFMNRFASPETTPKSVEDIVPIIPDEEMVRWPPLPPTTTSKTIKRPIPTKPSIQKHTTPRTKPKGTSKIPKTTSKTTTSTTTTTEETPISLENCQESQEGDCDPILVEGSIYTAFKVQA